MASPLLAQMVLLAQRMAEAPMQGLGASLRRTTKSFQLSRRNQTHLEPSKLPGIAAHQKVLRTPNRCSVAAPTRLERSRLQQGAPPSLARSSYNAPTGAATRACRI